MKKPKKIFWRETSKEKDIENIEKYTQATSFAWSVKEYLKLK